MKKSTLSRNRWVLPMALISFSCLCFCAGGIALGVQLFVNGCLFWDCAPSRSIRVLEMSLPRDIFPAGTVYGPLLKDDLDGASEKATQTVFLDRGSGTAVFIVTRWNGYSSARDDFSMAARRILSRAQDSNTTISRGVLPGADESIVYCGSEVQRCQMAARYEEYVVSFNADMDMGITVDGFMDFCMTIDQELSEVVR